MEHTRFFRALRAGIVLGSLIAGASAASQATAITYRVNRTIGSGSVRGFIETDGSIGVLSEANFVDWNLTLSDGKNTFQLTGPLSGNNSRVFVSGMNIEAVGNYLIFNFSAIDNETLLFFQGASFTGAHYYCDSSQPFICIPGETVVPLNAQEGLQNVQLKGTVPPIGVADAAPEPGSLGLLVIGASLLGWRVRDRLSR